MEHPVSNHSQGTSSPSVSRSHAFLLGHWFTAARRSGLLGFLSAERWQVLCALLSFTTQEGRQSFSLEHLGLALSVSKEEAGRRLHELANTSWNGQFLLELLFSADGEIVGARLAPIDFLTQVVTPEPVDNLTITPTVGKVEAILPSENDPLRKALVDVGLYEDQIDWIVSSFPLDRVQRQLEWLPKRHAKNPPAYLIRAIEENWPAPKDVK
jgi:hypothetical protein